MRGVDAGGPDLRAARREQRAGRTLDDTRPSGRAGVRWTVTIRLLVAVERHLADARDSRGPGRRWSIPAFSAATIRAASVGSPSTVSRAVVTFHFGVVAQHADAQGEARCSSARGSTRCRLAAELAGRRVAGAGHLDAALVQRVDAHGHLVPGQRPGLVGADDGGGAQSLDGGQSADERAHPGHALHPQRQRHGGHGGQPLGHGGDGQREADLQHVPEAR